MALLTPCYFVSKPINRLYKEYLLTFCWHSGRTILKEIFSVNSEGHVVVYSLSSRFISVGFCFLIVLSLRCSTKVKVINCNHSLRPRTVWSMAFIEPNAEWWLAINESPRPSTGYCTYCRRDSYLRLNNKDRVNQKMFLRFFHETSSSELFESEKEHFTGAPSISNNRTIVWSSYRQTSCR